MNKRDIEILKGLGYKVEKHKSTDYWRNRAGWHLGLTTQERDIYPVFDHGRAHGNWIYDLAGNKYLDTSTGVAFRAFGFRDPEMVEFERKIAHVAREMPGQDFDTIPQTLLAESLCGIAPGDFRKRIIFTTSGGRAVGAAVKSIIAKTGRTRFVGFRPAFHGRTCYSLPFTAANAQQKNYFPSPIDVVRTPYAYCYRCPFKMEPESCGCYCADYLEAALSREGTDIGGIIVEPICGEGGLVVPHPKFLPRLKRLANDLGAYLISDEVQAGMGRTGKWWACENFGTVPDYITAGKCLGGGYNLAATIGPYPMFPEYPIDPKVFEGSSKKAQNELKEKFMEPKLSRHSQTVSAEPFHALLALFQIRRIEKSLGDIRKTGKLMLKRLEEMQKKYEIVGDARGIGLMMGIEIVKSKKTKENAPRLRDKILKNCISKQKLILLGSGDSSIRLLPAYNTRKEEADEMLNRLEAGIKLAKKK